MTYDEVYADVLGLVKRADLADDIRIAIQGAILKGHQMDFWNRDLYEAQINLPAAAYITQLDTTLLSRFRNISYLRKYDPTGQSNITGQQTGQAGKFFDILDSPEQVMDSYRAEKSDIVYVAGSNLNIRSSTLDSCYLAGWFRNPILSPTSSIDSWIMNLVPYYIIREATRDLFLTIGYQEESRSQEAMVTEWKALLRVTGTQAKGR